MIINSFLKGLIGSLVLLTIYFTILTLISGWSYSKDQFFDFWYYILTLSIGFGLQIGLYTYLKNLIHSGSSTKVLAISGTTSTISMLSCCTHYLVNLIPILGVTGVLTLVSQYQVELFWFGIISNLLGITYIMSKIKKVLKHAKT